MKRNVIFKIIFEIKIRVTREFSGGKKLALKTGSISLVAEHVMNKVKLVPDFSYKNYFL